jgi:hypothetical protein
MIVGKKTEYRKTERRDGRKKKRRKLAWISLDRDPLCHSGMALEGLTSKLLIKIVHSHNCL